jgi:hypothetical protein
MRHARHDAPHLLEVITRDQGGSAPTAQAALDGSRNRASIAALRCHFEEWQDEVVESFPVSAIPGFFLLKSRPRPIIRNELHMPIILEDNNDYSYAPASVQTAMEAGYL